MLQTIPGPVLLEIPGSCPVCHTPPYRAGAAIVLFSCGMLYIRETQGILDPNTLETKPSHSWAAIYPCRNAIDISLGLMQPKAQVLGGGPSVAVLAQADKEVREEATLKSNGQVHSAQVQSHIGGRPPRLGSTKQVKRKPRPYHKTDQRYWTATGRKRKS